MYQRGNKMFGSIDRSSSSNLHKKNEVNERKRIEKILNSNFRLKKYKATKTEDKSGYTHKYLKSVQPGFDEVFRGMKGRSLGDNSLILHNLLQEI